MIGRILIAKLLYGIMDIALLIGLLPMPNHMSSMQPMHLGMSQSLISISQANMTAGNLPRNALGSCCGDAVGSFALTCAFTVPESQRIALYGDSQRVVYSVPVVQSIYIEVATLPPKI